MRNPSHIAFCLFLAFCICGCHDHEDAESQESSSSALQVTVVFYPGQVGDHGFADGLMDCVPQIGKLVGSDKQSHVDTQFFAYDSKDETQMALRHWASHPENPFLGGNYQRRLLVLTDARQVAWLNHVQTENLSDELLLLNASKEVVDSLAQTWGSRVHALNISVAHEMENFCRYIQRSIADKGQEGDADAEYSGYVDIYRMADSHQMADSIDIVCQSMLSQDISVTTSYMEEWQKDPVTGEISYVQSQQYARFLAKFYYQYSKGHFLLLDGGSYNLVFDELSPNEADEARTVFLDLNIGTDNYCIWRHYDQALIGWITDWMQSASLDAMPRITWHGSWDGYVESNI